MLSKLGRWAARLLPFVLLARALLLVVRLDTGHHDRVHADDPPAWPPAAGEVLQFRAGDPRLAGWAADKSRHPIVAVLASKDGAPQPPDTACLLDPGVMGDGGARLTLGERTADGTWTAAWDGTRTMRTRDEVDIPESDPAIRAAEAAMLAGADCGGWATLELSEPAVQALVDLLSGREPAHVIPPPRPGLKLRVELPQEPN
jgi:hypothetical protein